MSRPTSCRGVVRHHVLRRRHQLLLEDAGQHLHQAADGGDEQDAEDQQPGVVLQFAMQIDGVHGGDTCTVGRPFTVWYRFHAISTAPARKTTPATKRSA